jgi:hypothetical protein
VRRRAEEIAAAKKLSSTKKAGIEEQKGRIPQELRQKLKKSKGAKCLLQDLEEEVRKFVSEWERKQHALEEGGSGAELDSEDEEIVFVGRNGTMSDEQRKTVEEELEREKLVFDSLADDHGASFGYAIATLLVLETLLTRIDAGLSTPLLCTMASALAPLPLAILRDERRMWVSRR